MVMSGTRLIVVASAVLAVVSGLPASAYQRPGTTARVSLALGGRQPNGDSYSAVTSANGRYAAFTSKASNLTSGGSGLAAEVYRVDLSSHRTQLVSVGVNGLPGVGACPPSLPRDANSAAFPSISSDGRYVAFSSCATDLVTGDTNLAADVFVRDMVRGVTTRVDVTSSGGQTVTGSSSQSSAQAISADGRYVAFASDAYNLVPGRQPWLTPPAFTDSDVFVHDMKTGRTELETVSSNGTPAHPHQQTVIDGIVSASGPGCPYNLSLYAGPTISADGRYVAYDSTLDGLVPAANDGTMNVYVRDRKTGRPQLVNLTVSGAKSSSAQSNCGTQSSSISPNGRLVSYATSDQHIVPSDTVQGANVYVFDRTTGRTGRVSVTSDGQQYQATPDHFDQSSWQTPGQQLSPDGRYVVFQGILPGQVDYSPIPAIRSQYWACYVYDRLTGSLELASVSSAGTPANYQTEGGSTADGRRVLFWTGAANVVPGTQDASQTPRVDVFLRDRGADLGVGGLAGTGKLSVPGAPSFATTGIVGRVGAGSGLGSLLTIEGGYLVGASLAYRSGYGDLFVREQLESMPSVAGTPVVGIPGVLYGFDLTASGVHYEVRAQRVLGPSYDPTGAASFGLFRQGTGGLWSQVAALRGGYGTTGVEVVFALPLKDIGLQVGGRLSGLNAFTAAGSYLTGATHVLDQIALSR
jgi:Tol biopolymer transport system component